jgi:hypothetical protein
MPLHSQGEHTLLPRNIVFFLFIIALAGTACKAVKLPPRGVAFVYENKINLKAPKLTGEQKGLLVEKIIQLFG